MTRFEEHFADLPDPRVERTRLHDLLDLLAIALCAVIAGADGWDGMADFGRAKEAWFRRFLRLPNGIPCGDTFRRVLARLDPEAFGRCFAAWMQELAGSSEGKLVALDGKTMRHSFDKATGAPALHAVSAWVAENRLTLGQLAVDDDSNEIPALPKLIGMLDLEGAVVTVDAMGCQVAVAEAVLGAGADYVMTCKGNQPTMQGELAAFFEQAGRLPFAFVLHTYDETDDKEHGRVERRRVWCVDAVGRFPARHRWPGLRSIGLIERERTVGDGATSVERVHVLTSLEADAKRLGALVRGHWGIENQVHWILDIAFREDECRIRKDHGPANMGLLRKLALNLLKRETSVKRGIALKRLQAGWNEDYLETVLKAGIAEE